MKKVSLLYNAFTLLILCLNIILLFSLIYILLDIMHVGQIVEHHGFLFEGESLADQVAKTIYFSAITLLSVGYGDITPIGWSRVVAILEALVGYLLPAVITVQYLRLFPSAIERFFHFIKPTDKKNK